MDSKLIFRLDKCFLTKTPLCSMNFRNSV
uniref:Uncharacterized protein n=1 Tax=Arundo donax TaxID=35708 RepID=A0A0A9AC26_ARUDO